MGAGGRRAGGRIDGRLGWTSCDFRRTARNARCIVCHGHGRGRALCRWGGLMVGRAVVDQGKVGRGGQGRAGRVRFRYYSTRTRTFVSDCLSVCLSTGLLYATTGLSI